MFGLDTGGSVLGMAYRIAPGIADATREYLYGREMVTPAYAPRLVRAATAGGSVRALTFTVDRDHDQYAGRLPFAKALAVVRDARGKSGHNRDYVLKTARILDDLAVRDPAIQRLASELHDGGVS